MKTFIILLNFLLLTLILYNFINSKVVEYFSGCSGSSKNAVYRQQSKTDIMTSEINKLKTQYNALNRQNAIRLGNAVADDGEEEEEEEGAHCEKYPNACKDQQPYPRGPSASKVKSIMN